MICHRLLTNHFWLKELKIISHFQTRQFSAIPIDSKYLEKDGKSKVEFQKGQILHGFIVDQTASIDEMYLTAVKLTHIKTGAQYLHFSRDDSNNAFSIGFRTIPTDSTGVPHILEHVTLCGSEKFPCRDPFFKMLTRSLASFMNAITAPDYTLYPFSTQNFQDFKNLQSVYLDCVFKPKLRELDFRQEGWRLEHTDPNDKNTPIIFKGIVFNEMKGVFNSSQNIFGMKLMNTILPSHTYGVISGGDPLEIPHLKYQNFINFHATHYHPSNARFYSYGNFPLEHHLQFINDEYLCFYDRIDTSFTKIPSENKWSKPKSEHIFCQPDPLIMDSDKQSTIAIANLCNDITDVQETFDVYILSQLLLDGPNSAFYKSLIEENIGTGFGPMTGYESHCKDTIFSVSLQGVHEKDFERVKQIYKETVMKVIEEGFNHDHISAILHAVELKMKHQTSTYGLDLLFNLFPLWNHDGDIISSIEINKAIKTFNKKIQKDSKYLTSLMEKYLLQNNHQLTLTMSPDPDYESRYAAAENNLLESKLKGLTNQQLDSIFLDGQVLMNDQRKKENTNCLPSLKISDLKKDIDRYSLVDIKICGVPVQVAIEPTNNICYYRGVLSTKTLSNELKSVLPIFNNVVVRMGTVNYDYRNWDKLIHSKTGGLEFSSHVAVKKDDIYKHEEGIIAYSHCLDYNSEEMWMLWQELFNRVQMTDLQRFTTLVKIIAADLTNGIAHSGHLYAMSLAGSLVSPVANLKENLSGLTFVNRMKIITQMKDLSSILEQMQKIASEVLNKSQLRSAINLSGDLKDTVLKGMEIFYDTLDSSVSKKQNFPEFENSIGSNNRAVHYIFPYTVNYTAKAILTVPYLDPDYAPLQVLSKLISSIYLHTEIREKGGAYGGGANLSSDGSFTFYSYRDPNSTQTFDIFDKTWDFLSNYHLSDSEISEAKLRIFQSIDSPTPPKDRGMMKFIYDLTDEDIENHRDRLKHVTKEDIMFVANKYLNLDAQNIKIGRSLIGPYNDNLKYRYSENWTVIDQEHQNQSYLIT